jgi:hypothetical protein
MPANPANLEELKRLSVQTAMDLSDALVKHKGDKLTTKQLGRSILDTVEELIERVVTLHGIDVDELYIAMRNECRPDDDDEDDFGFGGDWWKRGKTD